MNKVLVNGILRDENEPALAVNNRAFRYGAGIFETMLFRDGMIIRGELHISRLQRSLELLGYTVPGNLVPGIFSAGISRLAELNNCQSLARARLAVYPGNGNMGTEPETIEYVLECSPLAKEQAGFNSEGLVLGLFPHARKSTGALSNIKSTSAMIYFEAARFGRQHELDDCVVLNSNGNIADTTIANLFIVKKNKIITTALSEGCVEGTMRGYLLQAAADAGFPVTQGIISPGDLETADECFLTNAVRGIRWVKQFGKRTFGNQLSLEWHHKFIDPV